MGDDFNHIELFKRLHIFQGGERQGQYVNKRSRKTLVMCFIDSYFIKFFLTVFTLLNKILTSKLILGGCNGCQ
jgi:hypothetical protein